MRQESTPPGAPGEISARELREMGTAGRHEVGAQLARELLVDAPASPAAPKPLASLIFDFAEAIELVGRLDLDEAR